MQKISVDLVRLAVSGAVVCAVVVAVNLESLNHRDRLADAEIRVLPPIHVQAISVAAPATCWATNKPIGASATQEAQPGRTTMLQSCANVAPPLRRHSESQSRLALAP
jgi:hypothetical protein